MSSLGRKSLLEAARGSRDLVSEVYGFAGIMGTAAQTGPHARQVREEEAVAPQPLSRVDFDKRQERDHGPYGSENEQLLVVPPLRLPSRSAAPEGERSSLAQHGLARLLVLVISVTAPKRFLPGKRNDREWGRPSATTAESPPDNVASASVKRRGRFGPQPRD